MAGELSDATILIADEDTAVLELLAAALRFQGCRVHTATTGAAALDLAFQVHPTAVVCELELPDVDGLTVLRQLRAQNVAAPVVFLTARSALADKLTALRAGGEDYITKPFSLEEVVLRLGVIVRRTGAAPGVLSDRVLTFADVRLDERSRLVCRAGQPVTLSPTEFELLRYFMDHPGVVVSKSALAQHLWPHRRPVEVTLVETYLSQLRRKLDTADTGDTALLHTLRGHGYVLDVGPRSPVRDCGQR